MYKIFSSGEVSSEDLALYFEGPAEVVARKAWRYTFPRLPKFPDNQTLQPLQPLQPFPHLYNLNAIESVAVAMEGTLSYSMRY